MGPGVRWTRQRMRIAPFSWFVPIGVHSVVTVAAHCLSCCRALTQLVSQSASDTHTGTQSPHHDLFVPPHSHADATDASSISFSFDAMYLATCALVSRTEPTGQGELLIELDELAPDSNTDAAASPAATALRESFRRPAIAAACARILSVLGDVLGPAEVRCEHSCTLPWRVSVHDCLHHWCRTVAPTHHQ